MQKLHWGILATGRIAKTFAQGVLHSQLGQLVAVGSRHPDSAQSFATEFHIPRAHGSYEALLADPEVQAVYISTPHPHHAEWILKAIEAGKHVLCEKPLTLNHAEAMVVAEAARAHDVLLMEAFMVRCHPFIGRLTELIRSQAIGEVRLIRSVFSFQAVYNPDGRLFNNALGGGGILDVGCYATTLSRLIAGAALDLPYASPTKVLGAGTLLESGVDGWATAILEFPKGIIAQLSTGVLLNQDNGIHVFGSEGSIHLPDCWIPAKEGGPFTFTLSSKGKPDQPITVESDQWLYALEADAFARAYFEGKRDVPEMPLDDTLDNMRTLDRWRDSIRLVYDSEQPSNSFPTVSRRPLAQNPGHTMRTSRIPGLDFDISRLVLGCDNQTSMPHAAALFDDFFARGGNAFDTAWLYAGGLQERLLGHWIQSRKIRDQVFVIGKGLHSPLCEPKHLEWQLDESLLRLQLDYVDLYLMHRDNPAIPAGDFVEELDRLVRKGKLKTFGGSNWSIERAEAANTFAHDNGLQGFSALSNQFSLAQMIEPVWRGCVSASDPVSQAWLKKTGTALFAWSSQARGFFTDRAGRDRLEDDELVRCWYSDENFLRRDRALELAGQKKTSAINIALAYVLHQDFPSFALIGPRSIQETASSFGGLTVQLTPEEIAWLNSGSI